MAILAGLALVLSDFYKPAGGRVVLLFQPAGMIPSPSSSPLIIYLEETGSGAQQMCDDKNQVLSDVSKNSKAGQIHFDKFR